MRALGNTETMGLKDCGRYAGDPTAGDPDLRAEHRRQCDSDHRRGIIATNNCDPPQHADNGLEAVGARPNAEKRAWYQPRTSPVAPRSRRSCPDSVLLTPGS